MKRRDFISNFSIFTGLALASRSLGQRAETFGGSGGQSALRAEGYGRLLPTAARNTGETLLSLPEGFEYNVLGRVKAKMSDGRPTPPLHDGMATFKVGNELRLIRNHEISNGSLPAPGAGIGSRSYDDAAGGGTTTLIIDSRTNTVVRDFVSLSGTLTNCSGGPTPWGSWISCEETTVGPKIRTRSDGRKIGGFPKPHGYCFEVPAAANSEVEPIPLKPMGRFVHEAVAVDRKTGVVYETEDYITAGFYRFVPARKGRLAEGGVLQMLAVTGQRAYDTRRGQVVGKSLPTSWVKIDDPDPEAADLDPTAVYRQGLAAGGATFSRLEGCEIDRAGRVFFTSTSGGESLAGQIWMYEPAGVNEGRLTLLFQASDRAVLHMPDNVCLMPKSKLLFVCEDSSLATPEDGNHVRILTPGGKIAEFAKYVAKDLPRSEFAGSTFSPDGKTLFVNAQQAGLTLAIRGDWGKFKE